MIYFTSDEHHDHYKLMRFYEKRPFETVSDMTNTLLENYAATLPEKATVFHIGDFSMVGPSRINYYENLAKRYGKIDASRHLVMGNHDQLRPQAYVNIELFSSVHTAFWMPYHEYTLMMVHDPAAWIAVRGENRIFIHGHVHSLYRTIPGRAVFNVGVDVNNFRPVSADAIIETLKQEGSL